MGKKAVRKMNNDEIRAVISDKLSEIEHTENVRILHCVESGSRAWGFASPDSDYDVRFIYVRKPEFYLRLEQTRDVIEWQLDDVLDINGWDLRKALQLLFKSNMALFEWNASPIVYKTSPEWSGVSEIMGDYFTEKQGLHHYRNMAENNYHTYLRSDEVRIKKYFYALRPVLCCRWIMEKSAPPPVPFSELLESELPDSLRPEVERLSELKARTSEMGTGKRIDVLNNYIKGSIAEIQEYINTLPEKHNSWDGLDRVFRRIVGI